MKITLATVGACALLLFSGAGLVGWVMIRDHVTLVMEEGEAARAPEVDPLDAVSADLAALGDDVRALARVLQENFARLDDRGAARQAELRDAWAAEGAALRARLDGLERAAEERHAVRSALEELRASLAGARGRPTPVAAEPEAEAEIPPESTRGAAAESPAVSPAVTEPPPPRPSFLAFSLPSDDFRFDERRAWTLVPALSRVGFDGTSTLHDFTGQTSAVKGRLELDLAHPDRAPEGTIEVEAASLRSGSEGRDEGMLENLAVGEHPEIRFVLTAVDGATVDLEARTVAGTARGRMTIRGVTRDVAMPIRAEIDGSRRLFFEGEMPLRLPDYAVPVPNKLGLVKMGEEVRVWIALRAKLVPRERP